MLNIKNKLGKALSLFIVLVLAMSVCLGLVACNDNTHKHVDADNDGYCDSCSQWVGEGEDPADHVHTFDTTVWEHDDQAHWHPATCGHTDQKGDRARHTFGDDRKCTECKYEQEAEIYIVGEIASQSDSHFPSYYQRTGQSISQVREDCILMERGADGVFSAEVYLLTSDEFAIYDYNLGKQYPANTGSGYPSLRVSEDNTYLVTYTLDAATPTFRIHDHKFADKYGFDADNHWKVCTDRDATPDTTKGTHDFTNGDCICGAKKPAECQHTNGFIFDYSELPVPQDSNGTLERKCVDCKKPETVNYAVGINGNDGSSAFASTALLTSSKRINCNLNVGENVYVTNSNLYLQMEITQAGTYIINIEAVHLPGVEEAPNAAFVLGVFGLSSKSITTGGQISDADLIFHRGAFNTRNSNAKTTAESHAIKVNGKNLDDYTLYSDNVSVISFTITQDDLTSGSIYVTIGIGYEASATTFYSTGKLGYLVSTKKED